MVTLDAPGHGATDPRHDNDDLWACGRRALELGGSGAYVGYSMGGRTALHAALLDDASKIGALVIIGATGGLDTEAERKQRRAADEQLARDLERDGLEAFLDRWLAQPLFAGIAAEDAARAERLTNRVGGLAASLRRCGTGAQEPLWERLHTIDIPVLVIAGERDAKFTALGQRLVDCIGSNAELALIPSAGHAAHTEQPAIVSALITSWIGAESTDR
jgi:2-succinyl-6-hydroxy-2,4-cyclohexadiene-1-carboxylate synthase